MVCVAIEQALSGPWAWTGRGEKGGAVWGEAASPLRPPLPQHCVAHSRSEQLGFYCKFLFGGAGLEGGWAKRYGASRLTDGSDAPDGLRASS